MTDYRRGRQSFLLPQPVAITAWASVAGKKEVEGPLSHTFDVKCRDTYFGQKTWEQAEKQMQQLALRKLADKAGLTLSDFGAVFSGDLLNQCIGSSFTLRNTGAYPAVGAFVENLSCDTAFTVSDNFLLLEPGEERTLRVNRTRGASVRGFNFPTVTA